MTKKELKIEIPGKVYPRSFEWIIQRAGGYATDEESFGRLCVPGGWILRHGLSWNKRPDYTFIPDPNHEWVLEPLKEEPEEETGDVMKELHKKTDEAFEDIRKYKLIRELKKKKTNKPWFSRPFRTNNG